MGFSSQWNFGRKMHSSGIELEETLFWRPARLRRFLGGRPLGLGGISRNFFSRRRRWIILIFSVDSNRTHRDLSKNDFFEILSIFLGLRQYFGPFFWQIFTFGKSARTIWKIYSIPAYSDGFRTLKKSLSVTINRSINLLTLVVRNCTQEPTTCKWRWRKCSQRSCRATGRRTPDYPYLGSGHFCRFFSGFTLVYQLFHKFAI